MQYGDIVQGYFKKRLNRFVAEVYIKDHLEKVHIKNTGRLKELLLPEAKVYLEKSRNPLRKTAYSLIAVENNSRMINIDSQAPNAVVCEALQAGKIQEFPICTSMKREYTFGHSRFDIYFETEQAKVLMEVKGVTLEEHGIAKFPDAPTARGTKHIHELMMASKAGYTAVMMFVVQMKGCYLFQPHFKIDRKFSEALVKATEEGVRVLAYDTIVTENGMTLDQPLPISLKE